MPARVLLLLPQTPHDPASGAPQVMLSIVRTLAAQPEKFVVRALSTTASEAAVQEMPMVLLSRLGHRATMDRRGAVGRGRAVVSWNAYGIDFRAMDTTPHTPWTWDPPLRPQFNALLDDELTRFTPNLVFTFGGLAGDQVRRQACAACGAKVVFAIQNYGYLHTHAFQNVHAVWSASRFIAEYYRQAVGLRSTPIPCSVDWDEVAGEERTRERFTFVNPSVPKGAYVIMRVIEQLGLQRPEIPLQIIEGRAGGKELFARALAQGIDLSRHPNLLVTPSQPRPRAVQRLMKALVMPSVWNEPFGRLSGECMINGTPVILSNRGGLSESTGLEPCCDAVDPVTCAPAGGLPLDIPAWLTPQVERAISVEEAEPWVSAVIRMHDDAAFYGACVEAARTFGETYRPEVLGRRYVEFFEGVLKSG